MATLARPLPEIDTALPLICVAWRRRSDSVSASRFTGETSSIAAGASSTGCAASAKHGSSLPVARLSTLFPTTPWRCGQAPVTSVAWPMPVTVSTSS